MGFTVKTLHSCEAVNIRRVSGGEGTGRMTPVHQAKCPRCVCVWHKCVFAWIVCLCVHVFLCMLNKYVYGVYLCVFLCGVSMGYVSVHVCVSIFVCVSVVCVCDYKACVWCVWACVCLWYMSINFLCVCVSIVYVSVRVLYVYVSIVCVCV